MKTAIFLCNNSNKITFVNKYAMIITNLTESELIGKNINDILVFELPKNKKIVSCDYLKNTSDDQIEIKCKVRGNQNELFGRAEPLYKKNYISQFFIFTLAALKNPIYQQESEIIKKYGLHLERIKAWILDIDNKKIILSKALSEFLGLDSKIHHIDFEDAMKFVYKDDIPKIHDVINNCSSCQAKSFKLEHRILTSNGNIKWAVNEGKIFKNQKHDRVTYLCGIINDITELKKTEEKLLLALKEKDLITQEIQHRIKNNLQLISSILRLRTKEIENQTVKDIVKSFLNKIRTMSIFYESFYKSNYSNRFNFETFIYKLVNNLLNIFSIDRQNINIKIEVNPINLNESQLMYCALILNELISNSLKHGIINNNDGELEINITKRNNKMVYLSVKDNGQRMPKTIGSLQPSFGLKLVNILTKQLKGEFSIERNGKYTIASIIFTGDEI